MKKTKEDRWNRIWAVALHFFSFFLLMCFVINCSMLLFMKTLIRVMGFELGRAEVRQAALLTFVNIVFLSLLCAVIDAFRRRIMVGRPVKRIIRASERVMQGDLSVRIEKMHSIDPNDGFNIVIDYFNRMTQELAGMETLRTDFIANVSHELKTPLAVMQNYGTLLQQADLPEEKRLEYAKTVTDASRRLSAMISNILKLNKLENQSITPEVEAYDVCRQLCECILQFEDAWDEKEIELETEIEDAAMVEADESLLELVWNNLLSNALKFTEPGGSITVKQTSEESLVKISVSDTGCGMDSNVMDHIFDKFYQGDTSHSKEGNGLGLALVKRVLELLDGNIQVYSEAGRGSTFLVTLPAAGISENENGGNQ